jgi:hypothetical protein
MEILALWALLHCLRVSKERFPKVNRHLFCQARKKFSRQRKIGLSPTRAVFVDPENDQNPKKNEKLAPKAISASYESIEFRNLPAGT